jgi:hypothetical protein
MPSDEVLLSRLRVAFAAVDPVPDQVSDAARAAFAWRTAPADPADPTALTDPTAPAAPAATLAELVADSAEGAPTGIRGDGDRRLLVFTGPDVAVEIEVTEAGSDREIVGRLAPPASAEVAVRHPGGEVSASADRGGHFVAAVPAGPVSLMFLLPDASSVVTSWVCL